jgi:very-short-patch-repair endonuclease
MKNGGGAKARAAAGGRTTKIEKIIGKALERSGMPFVQHAVIGSYEADFLVDEKLIVECDGLYWHSLPGAKQRDEKKDAFWVENGFCVVRLPEKEILNNKEQCLEIIRSGLRAACA